MNDVQIGRAFAAVRHELRLRQVDVGALARVDQKVVSLIERGLLERVSVARFRLVAAALNIDAVLTVRWGGGELDRLIDRVHAELVETISGVLINDGWEVLPEYTFNVYGERGSVDILAWHPKRRALLIVEVKSRLTDLQAMLMSMSRKIRLVPALVADERDWKRLALGRIVVVAGSRENRSVVERHAATFAARFPAGTREGRRWVATPIGDFAGVWFVAPRRASPPSSGPLRAVRRPRAQPSAGCVAPRRASPVKSG